MQDDDPVEELRHTVMVEMTEKLWRIVYEQAGGELVSISENRKVNASDLGKQLYSLEAVKHHGPR